jgi:hypothetical protein
LHDSEKASGIRHLFDEFANDYQLDSDVETFENLTGKKIRPVISS